MVEENYEGERETSGVKMLTVLVCTHTYLYSHNRANAMVIKVDIRIDTLTHGYQILCFICLMPSRRNLNICRASDFNVHVSMKMFISMFWGMLCLELVNGNFTITTRVVSNKNILKWCFYRAKIPV